jgi:hypothetical protein
MSTSQAIILRIACRRFCPAPGSRSELIVCWKLSPADSIAANWSNSSARAV